MIKLPIQLLRDDFFALTRIVKVPRASSQAGLQINDFSQDLASREPAWMIAMRASKQIKLLSCPLAGSFDAKVKLWQAAIPSEGTPL